MNPQQAPKQEEFKNKLSNEPKSDLDTFLDSDSELQNLESQIKDIEGKIQYEKPDPSTERGLKGMLSMLRTEATTKTLSLQKQFANNPNLGKAPVSEVEITPVTGQEERIADKLDRPRGINAIKVEDNSVWGNAGASGGNIRKDTGQKPV